MALFLMVFNYVFTKDWRKSGILATTTLVFVLSYGHIYEGVKGFELNGLLLGRHRYLLSVWGILLTAGYFVLLRKLHETRALTITLNTVTFILVGLQVVQLVAYQIQNSAYRLNTQGTYEGPLLSRRDENAMPDIYLIILDAYARTDAVLDAYNYDNRDFVTQLEAMGFFIAECSRSNYSKTLWSLPTQLNLNYVSELMDEPDHETLVYLLKNNLVQASLKEIGYSTYAFDTGIGWANMETADVFIDRPPELLGRSLEQFEELYLQTTIFRLLVDYATRIDRAGFHFFDTYTEMKAQRINIVLEHLLILPQYEGPKFVYAHILAPHPPYVFNPDGSVNLDARSTDDVAGYPAQLEYLNTRMVEIVEQILMDSDPEPIVVIEGDHGILSEKYRTSPLLAVYLPGDSEDLLYPSLSHVNVFRIVFNQYFGTDMQLLPDRSYHNENIITGEHLPHEEWNPRCQY